MKIFKLILCVILLTFILSACNYQRGILLFNTEPITKENVLYDNMNFEAGQRIYYLFIAPQKMTNKYIRVQIFKMTDKAPWGGNDVVRTKDYRLMQDQRYYHTDYFVLNEKGRYVMQIFSTDDTEHPLALDFFYVK